MMSGQASVQQSQVQSGKYDHQLLLADAADPLLRITGLKLVLQQLLAVLTKRAIYARRHWMVTFVQILLPFIAYVAASVKDYPSGQINFFYD